MTMIRSIRHIATNFSNRNRGSNNNNSNNNTITNTLQTIIRIRPRSTICYDNNGKVITYYNNNKSNILYYNYNQRSFSSISSSTIDGGGGLSILPFSTTSTTSSSIMDDVDSKQSSSSSNNNNGINNRINNDPIINISSNTSQNDDNDDDDNNNIESKLEKYTNRQLQLLAYIEQLHENNNNNNDDNNDDNNNNSPNDNESKHEPKLKKNKEKEYLQEIYNIANEMDVLLHHHYHQQIIINNNNSNENDEEKEVEKNYHYNMDHFNTVIDAWKIVIDAYRNNNHPNSNIHDHDSNSNNNHHHYRIPHGIPQRATRLLETMENHYYSQIQPSATTITSSSPSSSSSTSLSIDTYNNVLEMWSLSNEHNLNVRAESIYRRIQHDHAVKTTAKPNVETMKIMIRAWCTIHQNETSLSMTNTTEHNNNNINNVKRKQQRQGSAIFKACGYLIELQDLLESGKYEFEPSLEDYLIVFKSWGEVTDKRHAARRAWNLLRKMEELNLNRYTDVKPNTDCYRYVLQAICNSRIKYLPSAGEKVNQILSTMENDGMVPDSACFSYAIKTWCKMALNNESTPEQKYQHAVQAESLLKRMDEMYFRSGSIEVRPTAHDYYNVMEAFTKSRYTGAMERAEALLKAMEDKYHDGDALLMPSSENYRSIIVAWKHSPDVEKRVDGAKRVFEHMMKQYQNGNHACKPSVEAYNAIISVCRSADFAEAKDEHKRKALQCVTETISKMRASEEIELNAMTYNLILNAFGNLLENGSREQVKAIESVFSKCCAEGLVDKRVFHKMQRCAPYDVYRRNVLIHASKESDSVGKLYLPKAWSRNITGLRPYIPSVDGNFVSERNRNERKMRRLRTRKNQSLLQGGRMS